MLQQIRLRIRISFETTVQRSSDISKHRPIQHINPTITIPPKNRKPQTSSASSSLLKYPSQKLSKNLLIPSNVSIKLIRDNEVTRSSGVDVFLSAARAALWSGVHELTIESSSIRAPTSVAARTQRVQLVSAATATTTRHVSTTTRVDGVSTTTRRTSSSGAQEPKGPEVSTLGVSWPTWAARVGALGVCSLVKGGNATGGVHHCPVRCPRISKTTLLATHSNRITRLKTRSSKVTAADSFLNRKKNRISSVKKKKKFEIV